MKNFLRGKITFGRFMMAVFAIFFLAAGWRLARLLWDYRDVSSQQVWAITQSDYVSGGRGSVQVYASSIKDSKPVVEADVVAMLYDEKGDKKSELFKDKIREGALRAGFDLPGLEPGNYEMRISVDSKFGRDEVKKKIEILRDSQALVSTDRALYKPGQVINFRGLFLDQGSLKPVADKEAWVSISDPKGNKVYQKKFQTSKYGIIGGEFALAEELNAGNYKIEAKAGEVVGVKTVEVKYYSLPKFEVKILPETDLTKPSAVVAGKIQAKYFFGKPVVAGKVKMSLAIDGRPFEVEGVTDNDGYFSFSFNVDGPEAVEASSLLLAADVTDNSKATIHAEKASVLKQEKILVELIPESGKLKPGLSNKIIIIASNPDGTPTRATIMMSGERLREFATNDYGIATFDYTPEKSLQRSSFTLSVENSAGEKESKSFSLENENSGGGLIVRPDKSFYQGGQTMNVEILSTNDGMVQLELLQNDNIVYSDFVEVKNNRGSKQISVSDKYFGTMVIRAGMVFKEASGYYYGNQSAFRAVEDSRIVIVDQAKDLNVAITTDGNKYLPGGEAKLSINVTGPDGKGENSAVGLKIIDEALLALSSDSDALSKALFLVSEQVNQSAKVVNGVSVNEIVSNKAAAEKNDILTAILAQVPRDRFTFSEIKIDNQSRWNVYNDKKSIMLGGMVGFVVFLFFLYLVRLWWQVSALTAVEGITFMITGPAFLVGLLAATVVSWLVGGSHGYSYGWLDNLLDGYTSVFSLIDGSSSASIYNVIVYLITIILVIFIALARWQWVKIWPAYKKIVISFFALMSIVVMVGWLGNFDWLEQDSASVVLSLAVYFPALVIAAAYFMMAFEQKGKIFSTGKWLTIFALGVSWLIFGFGYLLVLVLLGFFGLVRFTRREKLDIDKVVENYRLKLVMEGKSKEASEIEILMLKEKLARRDALTSFGRAIAYCLTAGVVGFLALAFLAFVFRSLTVGNFGGSFSTMSDVENSIALPSVSRNSVLLDSAGSGFQPSNDLWGGAEAEISQNIGLSSSPPPFSGLMKSIESLSEDAGSAAKPVQSEREIGAPTPEKKEFQQATRVRRSFVETLLWEAQLVVENGVAELIVPLKDSITNWKVSALVNALSGKVGSGSTSFATFQDFFIDFSVPVNITKGDELYLPVTVYNYLNEAQSVKVVVKQEKWFSMSEQKEMILELAANESKTSFFKFKFKEFGNFNLRIDGQGTKSADAIQREVVVLPFGKKVVQPAVSERLEGDKGEFQAIFGRNAIVGTEKLIVKIYPTVLSQVVEGIESILRMPNGCFEQISSSLYPNVLALKYLKKTGKDNKKISEMADGYISKGLQKILTYEAEPGGFSLYGSGQAETLLTAYGLMEFTELSQVAFIDAALLERMHKFIYGRQQMNGSFQLIGTHNGGFSGSADIAKQAYVVWALSETNPKEEKLKKSLNFLKDKYSELSGNSYDLALLANIFVNTDKDGAFTKQLLSDLKRKIQLEGNNRAFLTMETPNHYGSWGQAGGIEASSLAAIAFARSGDLDFSAKLANYIGSKKDGYGTWGSTQATILALKALLENEAASQAIKDNTGKIEIILNGSAVKTVEVNAENSEVVQLLVFKDVVKSVNNISYKKEGKIDGRIEVIKDYYETLTREQAASNSANLQLMLPTESFVLGQWYGFTVAADVNAPVKNGIVEVPIASGFEVEPTSLVGQADSFEIKRDRLIFYFNEMSQRLPKNITYMAKPTYVGKMKMLPAYFYGYYNPDMNAMAGTENAEIEVVTE